MRCLQKRDIVTLRSQRMRRRHANHTGSNDHNFPSMHGQTLNDVLLDKLRQESRSARHILQPFQTLGRLALRPHHPNLRLVRSIDFHHNRL